MPDPEKLAIFAAVEGVVDESVSRRLVAHVAATVGTVYGREGKERLRSQIRGYNQAAKRWPWLVIVDLDNDADCAPPLRSEWLPDPSPFMCFRIAVRETESWLLADRRGIARFFRIAIDLLPRFPDALENPKRELVRLASKSSRRAIRDGLSPRSGSGRAVGPEYSSLLAEFVASRWSVDEARGNSESLDRAIRDVERVIAAWKSR